MSETKNPWLSTKAAAEALGITTRTLYRLIDGGELPAYKFGRVIRLKKPDIEDFIDSSRIEPGTLKHLYPDPRDGVPVPPSDEDHDAVETAVDLGDGNNS